MSVLPGGRRCAPFALERFSLHRYHAKRVAHRKREAPSCSAIEAKRAGCWPICLASRARPRRHAHILRWKEAEPPAGCCDRNIWPSPPAEPGMCKETCGKLSSGLIPGKPLGMQRGILRSFPLVDTDVGIHQLMRAA
jgi:hypothetical protein